MKAVEELRPAGRRTRTMPFDLCAMPATALAIHEANCGTALPGMVQLGDCACCHPEQPCNFMACPMHA